MIGVQGLLLTIFASGFLVFIIHHLMPSLRDSFATFVVLLVGVFAWIMPVNSNSFTFTIANFHIIWGNTQYSRLFAMIISVISFFAFWYSGAYMKQRRRLGYFYMMFLFVVGAMYGIVYSQDLLSFFFFWEIMTVTSFLLTIYCCREAQPIGLKYFIFSAVGAYSMLMAMLIVYVNLGSFSFAALFGGFKTLNLSTQIAIVVLFLIGMGVKSATMPFHVWAPGAYSVTPSPFSAVFSGLLSKMGIFGIGIVMLKLASQTGFYHSVQIILAWMGGLSALFATFYAVFSDDAKVLLAYSSVAQLGYIVVGIAVGTPLSIMAGLFLAILHGIFKSLLFFVAGAVYYRTGTTDLTKVSGLIRKMPYTFFAGLFGIIALAGVPPLAGFAGKWLLYESLINANYYFLVVILFAASTAAFLYLYKFIFSLFLGQEEEEFADVKEVPLSMRLPMIILALSLLLFGVFPGLLLKPISLALFYLGNYHAAWQNTVLFNEWNNKVDLFAVVQSVAGVFILAAVLITIFKAKSTRYVTTKDIHTSGEIPLEEENLTYAVDFYKPFERALGIILKASVNRIYSLFADFLEQTFDYLRYVYTGNGQTYAMYVILFLSVLLVFSELIFGVILR